MNEARVDEQGEGGEGHQRWLLLLHLLQFRECGQPVQVLHAVIGIVQQRILGLTEWRVRIEYSRLQSVRSVHRDELEGIENDSLKHVHVDNGCLGRDIHTIGGCAQRANFAQLIERHLGHVDGIVLVLLVVRRDEVHQRVECVEQRLLDIGGAHIVETARDHHLLDIGEVLVDAAAHTRQLEHDLRKRSRRWSHLAQLRGQLLDGVRSADTYAGQSV